MEYIEFNNNPVGRRVGDCAVRAVAKALDTDWESAYTLLTFNGFSMGDMPVYGTTPIFTCNGNNGGCGCGNF